MRLARFDLTGTDLGGATLSNAQTAEVLGCPTSLPSPAWICAAKETSGRYVLVGPGVDLSGGDLADADLSAADFTGVRAVGLTSCPAI